MSAVYEVMYNTPWEKVFPYVQEEAVKEGSFIQYFGYTKNTLFRKMKLVKADTLKNSNCQHQT
jgi:hypothetical protein